MRAENSIKNTIVSVITNVITILIGFVAQKVFLSSLGIEYLGINGLFNNIISMLGIVELGIGSAIIFNLYKPISEKDNEKIKSLMRFYKSSYRIIAIIIFIIGIAIIPFLNIIVGEVNIQNSIYVIYAFFLFDIICSYMLTYKRSILYADQKTYIVNLVHIGYLVIMNALQIIFLLISKNYIIYLIIKVIFRILENVVITIIANKKYECITERNVQKLDQNSKNDIFKKIKALVFHKIGGFIVNGTDNIIISMFLGVVWVGMYSNYYMIITAINNVITQIYSSLTASIGNLLVEKNKIKNYEIYKRLLFFNFWLSAFCAICFYTIVTNFISIVYGEQYLLSQFVVIVLSINLYFQNMRKTMNSFKEAAGIYYEDRFVPLFESAINIIFSVLLVYVCGLAGVFIGTIFSSMVLHIYSFPKYVYEPIMGRKKYEYILDNLKYFGILIIVSLITIVCNNIIIFDNIYIDILKNILISLIIPNIIFVLIFRKTNEYQYYKAMIINLIRKITKKII